MSSVETTNNPKGNPGRADHVAIYGVYQNRLIALAVNEAGELISGSTAPGTEPSYDELTGSLKTIDTFHGEVHEGEAFSVYVHTEDGADLGNDNEINIVITVPAGKELHLTGGGHSGGNAEIWFGTAGDISGGTPFTPVNLSGVSSEVSGTTVLVNATVGSFTSAYRGWIIGGTRNRAFGGELRANAERILAPGTYAIRLTNRAGSAQPADLEVLWYEETSL